MKDEVLTYEAARMLGTTEYHIRKECRNGFLRCRQDEIGAPWHITTRSILEAIEARLRAVFPTLAISDVAQIEELEQEPPTSIEERRKARPRRTDGTVAMERRIETGRKIVNMAGEYGYHAGVTWYDYPRGSESSYPDGEQFELHLLEEVYLHPDVMRELKEHHGRRWEIGFFRTNKGEESHQGGRTPYQLGRAIQEYAEGIRITWCDAKDARLADDQSAGTAD